MIQSKDDLEEQGLIEVCTNCQSINLKEYKNSTTQEIRVVCEDCGTVDFTHVITEEEYVQNEENKK